MAQRARRAARARKGLGRHGGPDFFAVGRNYCYDYYYYYNYHPVAVLARQLFAGEAA